MKRILFVSNTLGRAGAENALLELLKRLDSREYQVSLYVLLGQGELVGRLPSSVRLRNRRFDRRSVLTGAGRLHLAKTVAGAFFRNGGLPGKLVCTARALASSVRTGRVQPDKLLWRVVSDGAERFEETFDLAVAWLEGGSAYYVADHVRSRKKAAFLHVDYESAGYTRAMDRDCWRCFDRIFTVSASVRDGFLAVYPEYARRTAVLPNLLDQAAIRRRSAEPGGFCDDWNGLRLLSVGRLTYQKGYDVAIEAMKLLKDAGYRARWYVLGEGDRRRELERQIGALGLEEDFLLLGAVENPCPYYAQADVYVHATRFEGRSIALQEAQTLGCPVVASDCGGNREQVEDGKDGLLCQLTPQAVAEAAAALLKDPERRAALGAAAAAKEAPVGQELEMLLELLTQRDGP